DGTVFGDRPAQAAALGLAHRENALRGRGVVNQAVAGESTDAVEHVARGQVALGDGHDLADGARGGRDGGILEGHGGGDGHGDLHVGEVIRGVEAVEGTIAELEIAEVLLAVRVVAVGDDPSAGAGCGSQHVIHQAAVEHAFGGEGLDDVGDVFAGR